MKKYFLILFIFISLNEADAQLFKSQKDMSEIGLNKNHLELDIKNIFTGLSGASIIYKRRLESGKYVKLNSLNLLRAFATFNYNIKVKESDPSIVPNTEYDYVPDAYPADNFSNRFGVGLEWQKMHKGFVHYIGSDLILGYDKSGSTSTATTTSGGLISRQIKTIKKINTYSAGINPFFGIKYYFNPQLSLGIETGVYLGYSFRHINTDRSTYTNSGGKTETTVIQFPEQKNSSILTSFNNLRFLNVGYCF